jgi:hypothetical protein
MAKTGAVGEWLTDLSGMSDVGVTEGITQMTPSGVIGALVTTSLLESPSPVLLWTSLS